MPLDKQIVGVNFTQGLDTQTDKRLVLPGKMVALQNATMQEEDTFKRRNGNTALVTGTAFRGVLSIGDALAAVDGVTLERWSASTAALVSAGTLSNLTLTKDFVVHNNLSQSFFDVATSGTVTCYVYNEADPVAVTNTLMVVVVDEATGTRLMAPTSMSTTGVTPRVVYLAGAFFIFYMEAPNLRCRVILTASPSTLGAAATLRTDMSAIRGGTTAAIDATTDGTSAFVIYSSNDATNSIRAVAVTRSGSTPSVSAGPANLRTVAVAPVTTIHSVAIAWFTGTTLGVYALLDTGTAAGVRGINAGTVSTSMVVGVAMTQKDATGAAITADTGNANIVAARNASGSLIFVYSDHANSVGVTQDLSLRTFQIDSTNAVTTGPSTLVVSRMNATGLNGPNIAGKPLAVNGEMYLPICMVTFGTGGVAGNTGLQNSWFMLDSSGRLVAKALYGQFGPNPANTNYQLPPSTVALSSLAWIVPVSERDFLSFSSGQNISYSGLSRFVMTVTATGAPVRGQLGPVQFLANATTALFDGDLGLEAGTPYFPEGVVAASGGAGNVDAGTRSYVALYELEDSQGQRYQSAPSPAVTYTQGGATVVQLTLPTLLFGRAANASIVSLAVYRTLAAGTIYHRVFPIIIGSNPIAYPNQTNVGTITFIDNTADASVQSNEILYTTGGILPNNAPPPCSTLAIHQNRVFINPSDDPYTYQPSQPWVSGFGVQWSETLRGRVEATGGTVTAFASIDDKLIIFRPRKIGVLFGQGPATTGIGSTWQLQDLPTDVGCSEPRSVLVMPEGVIFKSTSKGWYRLGRDLVLTWIGEGVQEWDSQGVTSAVLLDTQKECRFTTNDAEGLTLVYHYQRKEWSTYSNFTGVDAVWWPGGNAYVRATATKLIKELPPTTAGLAYGDLATTALGAIGGTAPVAQTGSVIPMTFRTGWLKPGEALQAFQRIWRVLLTGAAAGYPPPYATLTAAAGPSSDPNSIFVADTSVFAADVLLGNGLTFDLGNASYENDANPYTIISATRIDLSVPLAIDHSIGAGVRGTIPTTISAAGSMTVKFYFDGDDSAAFQTISIADVSTLVSGNAWNVRLQPNLQKCDAIMVEVTSTPSAADPGASLNFSGMTMELGVKKGAKKFNAAQTK